MKDPKAWCQMRRGIADMPGCLAYRNRGLWMGF